MTSKEFFSALARDKKNVFQSLLEILMETGSAYCLIGGLAVNACAEPVVSLDIGLVVAVANMEKVREAVASKGWKIQTFPHSLNLASRDADLRIQIQTDARYQEFISRAIQKEVFGYSLSVAAVEDVLQGKIWAWLDPERRGSKRQKDLADIFRLVEYHPRLLAMLPEVIKRQITE